MYNTGLIHSGISWWGVYTVVLGTNVPSSCRKYLVYEHFHEHCHLKDVVCARPLWWHCPGATQKLLHWVSSLWWEMKAVSCSKCCKGHFWTEHTSNLHVAFLGWKPCGKALCVLLLPVSSALLCGHTTLQRIRCLNRPVLQPVCVSFACCLPGPYLTLSTCLLL